MLCPRERRHDFKADVDVQRLSTEFETMSDEGRGSVVNEDARPESGARVRDGHPVPADVSGLKNFQNVGFLSNRVGDPENGL